MQGQKYLAHIDGLRALAVLSVIFYHLNANIISAGFLGVDIFFVISGFLITNIVYREKLDGKFNYLTFYARRVKRIIPALYFVLISVMLVSYIVLMPYDLFKSSISIISTLLFVSNYQFALRSGDYFSGNAEEWPLLHTWSLAVEEQYYFILPLIILLLIKRKRSILILTLSVIIAVALTYTEIASRTDWLKSFSYYGLPTRIQELMIGSLAAIISYRRNFEIKSDIIAIIAIGIILAALFMFNSTYPFPSIIVLPLAISVIVLVYSRNTIVNTVLEIRLITWIGKLSYSLYLVHWPVMAISRYILNVNEGKYIFTTTQSVLVLAITLILSCFSYYVVEKPLRFNNLRSNLVLKYYFLAPTTILIVISTIVILKNGIPSRFDSETKLASKQYFHIDKNKCPNLVNIGCMAHGQFDNNVYLYGNSHAEHYFEFMSYLGNVHNFNTKLYASGGCGVKNNSQKCNSFRKEFYEAIDSDDIVFYAYRYDHIYSKSEEVEAIKKELLKIKLITDKIVILAQPPKLKLQPLKMINCERLNIKCSEETNDIVSNYPEYNEAIKRLADSLDVIFFNPYQSNKELSQALAKNLLYYSDNDHLSVYGSQFLAEYLIEKNLAVPYLQ